jgi:AraC-like ligand binding domain
MFSLEASRGSTPIFTILSVAVLIGLTGQILLAQTGRLPTRKEGITVQYGTDTAAPGIRYQQLPSNQTLGVNIDHFIGNWATSHPYLSQGGIFMWSILTHSDPLVYGKPGAILEYRKELAVGELAAGDQTPLVEIPDQLFLYVESGEGRLDDGQGYWDLREGIAALIPPHAQHRFGEHIGQAAEDANADLERAPRGNPAKRHSGAG